MENLDLLESLRELVHCAYISDLRFDPYLEQAKRELQKMDVSHYPLPVLEEGIGYLFGFRCRFSSTEEAACFLRSKWQYSAREHVESL